MITIPENGYTLRMLTIDNGSNTLGLSIIELDLRTGGLKVIHSETCDASKTVRRYQYIADNHGDRYARFKILREYVRSQLETFDPDEIVIETPFMHRHPSAYATLREALYVITDEVSDFDHRLEVIGVTPMEAKKAVGALRYDKGKDPIRTAVLSLNDVYYSADVDPTTLDEHCIDSIAVGYCRALEVMKFVKMR